MGVQCKRCGRDVISAEVRYLDESTYVCEQCYLAEQGKPRESAKDADPVSKYDASPVSRVTLEREKCGFINKFREDSSAKRICSYCGGSDLKEPSSTAAQLLAESEETTTE